MTGTTPLSLPDAQARVLARFHRLPAEAVDLAAARGRTLAADAIAADDLPAFTNSAMDGYAVRAADITDASAAAPVRLRLVAAIAAGDAPSVVVGPGMAAIIATGAPLPAGADAIVRAEEAAADAGQVTIRAAVAAGAHVRARGESVRRGGVVMPAGMPLTPGRVALLAAVGAARPAVVRRPRVAVLSTGNELVPVGQPCAPGQIADVNGPLLAALVAEAGGLSVPCGIARDTPEALRDALRAAGDVDCIVTSGGVSVGAHDALHATLAAHGTVDFRGVAMRPGAPTIFGAFGATPLLALPGNPVAAFVAFALLARPALARMLGRQPEIPPMIAARLTAAVQNTRPTPLVLRARLGADTGGFVADTSGDQAVGNIASLAVTEALVIVPPHGTTGAGETVPAIRLTGGL